MSTPCRDPELSPSGASLTEQVYRRLSTDIVDGRLSPGQQLLETALARELGVSRTPVREAIRLLINEGLAMAAPGGVVVTQLTVKDVQDLLETERVLDGLACRLAAQRGSDEQMAQLEEIMARMESASAAGDLTSWIEADRQLHDHIALMADNHPLARFTGQVNSLLFRMRHLSVRQPGRLEEANAENRRVVEAIKCHDADRAELAVKEHVRNVERVVVGILENFVVPFKGQRF